MDALSLDLNLLRVLVGAVNTRSVTRMGERLGLSQPAASRAMAKLRTQLGDRVLVRTSVGYAPTSRALAMLPAAEAALAAGERIFAAETFSPASSTRRFALASTDYGAVTVIATLMPALTAAAPHTVLRVLPWGEDTLDQLDSGSIDLALYADDAPLPAEFHAAHLFRERYAMLCRRGHPALRGTASGPVKLATLGQFRHAMMLYPEGRRYAVDDVPAQLGLKGCEASLEIPYFAAAPLLIADTDLLLIVPERLARHFSGQHRLVTRPVRAPALEFGYRVVWHERVHGDAHVRWLRELIVTTSRSFRDTGRSNRRD